ncbi:MAG: DUF4383 domain-containing protein [Solirubrobacterales bacterium]|nr:DUF4383 domain-containing protein [Solirubrobacterales bacterium]
MPDQSDQGRVQDGGAGPARLYALAAGAVLSLLGVLGFFYDAGFDTGRQLAADDIAGVIVVNGWRNVVYLATGLLALGFGSRRPRRTAAALAVFYLAFGLWGIAETDHDIGNILEVLPLTDEDNVLHLLIGGLGAIAAIADGPLPKPKPSRERARGRARSESA